MSNYSSEPIEIFVAEAIYDSEGRLVDVAKAVETQIVGMSTMNLNCNFGIVDEDKIDKAEKSKLFVEYPYAHISMLLSRIGKINYG